MSWENRRGIHRFGKACGLLGSGSTLDRFRPRVHTLTEAAYHIARC